MLLTDDQTDHDEKTVDLPTNTRLLGGTQINTSTEPNLNIMITRDRLQETRAYKNLIDMIVYSLEYFSFQERVRGKPHLFSAEEEDELLITMSKNSG